MPDEPRPPHKDKLVSFRVDPDTFKRAEERARPFGGISAVMRAFLRLFGAGEVPFSPDDLGESNRRAQKRSKPKPTKKRK